MEESFGKKRIRERKTPKRETERKDKTKKGQTETEKHNENDKII